MNYQIVIPARLGSKRFPGKNKAVFLNKFLIEHTIEFALKSFSLNNIWINSDDNDIEKIAEIHKINFTKRPDTLSTDTTPTSEVLEFQLREFEKRSIKCDAIILLQVTNPLRPVRLIEDSIDLFENSNRNSLASFSVLNRKFGKIMNNKFFPSNYLPGQRMQDIIPSYFENGLIYITKSEFIKKNIIVTEDVFPLIYNGYESIVDIDEPIDLEFAEFIYKRKNHETIY